MTNTTNTKHPIGYASPATAAARRARTECSECHHLNPDHAYGCSLDTSMRLLPVEARTLRRLARAAAR